MNNEHMYTISSLDKRFHYIIQCQESELEDWIKEARLTEDGGYARHIDSDVASVHGVIECGYPTYLINKYPSVGDLELAEDIMLDGDLERVYALGERTYVGHYSALTDEEHEITFANDYAENYDEIDYRRDCCGV